MSSEHDESAETLEDLSLKSDTEKSGSPPPKKFQGPGEHAKPKRRRRGKRRKQRKASGAAESENPEDSETHPETEATRDSPSWDSDEEYDCKTNAYNDVIIRPINVPKAPENSTQFIIDDHNLCHLYMSFETPNPYLSTDPPQTGENDSILEPSGTDAAYIDIDFEYDPPQDFDNSAYYDREFENSYKSNRFDELLRLPRNELVSGLRVLEARLKELSDEIVKEDPSPILEQLQAELLELQEKHIVLKETNTSLRGLLSHCEVGPSFAVSNSQAGLSKTNLDKMNVLEQGSVVGITLKLSPCDVEREDKILEELKSGSSNEDKTLELGMALRRMSDEMLLAADSTSDCTELKQGSELAEVISSSKSEQSVLRDLPCRDLQSLDESSRTVTPEEHELSAAVLV